MNGISRIALVKAVPRLAAPCPYIFESHRQHAIEFVRRLQGTTATLNQEALDRALNALQASYA